MFSGTLVRQIAFALWACSVVFGAGAAPLDGVTRRSPLTNSRFVFETTGKGTVAFLGGSITEMPGWRVQVIEELRKRFPKTEFTFTSAGISSTCSDAGAYRFQEDILNKGVPDLLFVEYAVNDSGDGYYLRGRHDPATYTTHSLRGVEGILRQARRANPKMDLIMTFFVAGGQLTELRQGKTPSSYTCHGRIADHYGITTVSIGEALAAAEKSGSFDWKRYGADCHPKSEGCAFITGIYRALFDVEWQGASPNESVAYPLPAAIDPLSYTNARFLPFSEIRLGDGWQVAQPDWKAIPGHNRTNYRKGEILSSTTPGAVCSFTFTGTAVGAWVLAGPDSGSVEVSIDGRPFQRFELFSPYSKGANGLHYPFVETFADDLAAGEHTVRLRVGEKANPASTGHAVRLYRLCVN
ncbi:MAG: SGNH/GDSL hydrolase family protein [Kiritimatiellae bacterium]|nr:SGNH/GDSL hydrolase family protein [Kiritimatiellia bacterium]